MYTERMKCLGPRLRLSLRNVSPARDVRYVPDTLLIRPRSGPPKMLQNVGREPPSFWTLLSGSIWTIYVRIFGRPRCAGQICPDLTTNPPEITRF